MWTSASSSRIRPLRIMMIDDNPADLMLAEEVLEEYRGDCEVVSMNSGVQALSHLDAAPDQLPDLLLLDINMPAMNGFEVLKQLKSRAQLQHIPVIMLTTSNIDRDVRQAYEAQASSYLVKASSFEEFQHQLAGMLAFWRAAQMVGRP